MKYILSCVLMCVAFTTINAQNLEILDFPMKMGNNNLDFGLAGGLTAPQFSEIDLNNDGIQDLFIFDRAGYVRLTFINGGDVGQSDYTYAPEYEKFFPEMDRWVVIRDFNGDGAADIFTSSFGNELIDGVIVYQGRFEDGHIAFERMFFPETPKNVIPIGSSNGFTNLYVSRQDYPAMDDMDGDGDLDILSFSLGGGYVSYFENRSIQLGHGLDSLKFVMVDNCWGRFYESGITEEIDLSPSVDSCSNSFWSENASRRHAGSTLLTFDNDGDGDKELLVGDLSFNNLNLLTNGGSVNQAFMTEQDIFFPSYNVPADVVVFPAAFYLDINNDGKKDLLASPNKDSGEDLEVVWRYNNLGETDEPQFQFVQRDFLVNEMFDMGTDAHPAFLDYDADGLLDLVVGNNTFYAPFGDQIPRIYLFRNVGTATSPSFELVDEDFMNFSDFYTGQHYAPAPTFGDLDNDGDLDVLIGENSGGLYYGENTGGAGNPVVFNSLQFGYMDIDQGQASIPQIVDLNRDGLPDIVMGERNATMTYFQNEGTPESPLFVPNETATVASGNNIVVLGQFEVKEDHPLVVTGYAAPCILDFNGEYHMFVGSESGQIYYANGIDEDNLGGAFNVVTDDFGKMRDGWYVHPAIADINNDGELDMVLGNHRGGLTAYKTGLDLNGIPVSINYVASSYDFRIFPNPARDQINLELADGRAVKANVQLFNTVGQMVLQDQFVSNRHQLSVSNLPSGVYVCRMEVGSEIVVHRILIQ